MFKEGDRVKCIDASDTRHLSNNFIYTVWTDSYNDMVHIKETACYYLARRFELVDAYPTLRGTYV